jgi:hypothetical protein
MEIGVVVMMVVMAMMMIASYHHNLRLRRIRRRIAEEESESEQNLFHSSQYDALQIHLQSCSDRCVVCLRACLSSLFDIPGSFRGDTHRYKPQVT